MVWYSHLFQNFPQFIVIHTVKGFGIVNKAEIDVFLELPCFFDDPADVGNLLSAFSKTRLNIWKFTVHILKPVEVVKIGKRSPKWQWLKTKKGKALKNGTKENLRAAVRTSGETHTPPG